jgi:cobalt/nickel transport system permease protein
MSRPRAGDRVLDLDTLDSLGQGNSAIHRLDARAKLVVTLAFIIAVVSMDRHAVGDLLPFFLFPIVLVAVSGVPAGFVLRRIAMVAPFAVLVGAFNPLLDREVALSIGSVGISGGWLSFASILLRFALTIGAVLILVATTPVPSLGRAAEALGTPRVFVTQLLGLYRYLFLLSDEMHRVLRAYRLRMPDDRAPSWRVFAGILGQLLLRAVARARRVHEAMLCRGFDGGWRLLATPRMGSRDWLFMAGWMALFAALRLWFPARAVGEALVGG